MPHVFERFYRPNPPGQEREGLGLAIASWIAVEHLGSITVESELEKGRYLLFFCPFSQVVLGLGIMLIL